MKHAASNFMVFLQMLTIQNDSWWEWLRAWEKHSWYTSVCMYGCSVWGWLSNLKHVSLYWCIIMYNSSAAAVPINVSLHFTCCHIPALCNNYISITILFACHAKAEWSSLRCGEFLYFKTIKREKLPVRRQAAFPCRACQLLSPIMFSSCWWNAKAYGKQAVILTDGFHWPSVLRFLVKRHSLPFAQTESQRRGRAGRRCDW